MEPFLVGDQLEEAILGGPVDGKLVFDTGTQHDLALFVPLVALPHRPGQHLGHFWQSPLGVVVRSLLLGRDLAQPLDFHLGASDVIFEGGVPVGVWSLEISGRIRHYWELDVVLDQTLVEHWL